MADSVTNPVPASGARLGRIPALGCCLVLAMLAGCGPDVAEEPGSAAAPARPEAPAAGNTQPLPIRSGARLEPASPDPPAECLDQLVTELGSLTSQDPISPAAPTLGASPDEPGSAPPPVGEIYPGGSIAIRDDGAASPTDETAVPSPQAPDEDGLGAQAAPTGDRSLAAEVAALRQEVRDLRQTVDARVGSLVLELHAENRRLREEVSRLRAAAAGDTAWGDYVPRPGGQTIEEILEQAMGTPPGQLLSAEAGTDTAAGGGVTLSQIIDELRARDITESAPSGAQEVAPASQTNEAAPPAPGSDPPLEFLPEGYAIMRKWGRTPEEAEALGSGAPSLRGMVLVVPPSRSDHELIALGRTLRAESAGYANVNIEVFDTEEAARQFIQTSEAPPERRVLQVTRHRETGADSIFLWRHGLAIDVPLEE